MSKQRQMITLCLVCRNTPECMASLKSQQNIQFPEAKWAFPEESEVNCGFR